MKYDNRLFSNKLTALNSNVDQICQLASQWLTTGDARIQLYLVVWSIVVLNSGMIASKKINETPLEEWIIWKKILPLFAALSHTTEIGAVWEFSCVYSNTVSNN